MCSRQGARDRRSSRVEKIRPQVFRRVDRLHGWYLITSAPRDFRRSLSLETGKESGRLCAQHEPDAKAKRRRHTMCLPRGRAETWRTRGAVCFRAEVTEPLERRCRIRICARHTPLGRPQRGDPDHDPAAEIYWRAPLSLDGTALHPPRRLTSAALTGASMLVTASDLQT